MNRSQIGMLGIVVAAVFLLSATNSEAYSQYAGGCDGCHGDFTAGLSPKGSTFPGDDKHQMHRGNSDMNTECLLCHTSVGDNPMIGSSGGTANNTGYGCVGCHGRLEDGGNDGLSAGYGAGLRQHHNERGITACAGCHTDADPINYTPVGEQVKPPYYGTADTNADMSCNPTQTSGTNENWTIGDFEGLNNDGDLMYDGLDPDCAPAGDFDFDGRSDILWRNGESGRNWLYQMNGATIESSTSINYESDQNWQIVGNGDYDGDGDADILWRNSYGGGNWMYLMDSGMIDVSQRVNRESDQNWQIVGNGDYNGDGKSDILWRNSETGRNWLYLMNGTTIDSKIPINYESDQNWQIVGDGDYNGDGKSDILWRNSETGRNWLYLMNGATIKSSTAINYESDQNWQIVGSGDYDGDGRSDILWRNSVTGLNWLYLMNGATIKSSAAINYESDQNWQIVGSGDYDGDGRSDILWRNSGTGRNWLYLMNGATIESSIPINYESNQNWQVINTD